MKIEFKYLGLGMILGSIPFAIENKPFWWIGVVLGIIVGGIGFLVERERSK